MITQARKILRRRSWGKLIAAAVWCSACTGSAREASEASVGDLLSLVPQATFSRDLAQELSAATQDGHEMHAVGGWWEARDGVVYERSSLNEPTPVLLLRRAPAIADGTVSAEIRLPADGDPFAAAGLLFRMRDDHDGYALRIQATSGLAFVALRNGVLENIATAAAPIELGRRYTLRAAMRGGHFTFFLDGRQVLEATADTAPPSGSVGVFRERGAGVAFGNLSVEVGKEPTRVPLEIAVTSGRVAPLVSRLGAAVATDRLQPWQLLVHDVRLGEDGRTSLVVPPDSAVRLPLTLPAGGFLQYEVGVLPSGQEPTGGASQIRIGFETRDGAQSWLDLDYVSEDVHERKWRAARIDVPSRLAGRAGFLIFRNQSIGSGPGAYAAFANPAVWTTDPARRTLPHVVLITVDTLRADALGAYGYGRDTSPFIDGLARSGVLFQDVEAQSSWTKTSMASLLTSTYPETNGVRRADDRLASGSMTLARILRENGYFTAAVQTNPWMHPRFQLDQGFAEYRFQGAVPGARVIESAVEILRRRSAGPVFLYLHFMDVHHPYTPSPPYQRFGGEPRDAYDGEIRYLDDQLAALFSFLEHAQLLGDTLWVMTSDHGEEFGEHDGRYHGKTLYREQLKVPWIMRWPDGLPSGIRADARVQNVDIAPTILDLLGLATPAPFEGASRRSSLPPGQPEAPPNIARFAQVGLNDLAPDRDLLSVTTARWKYIKDRRSDWRRLFDRLADPGEQHDLVEVRPGIVAEMEERCDHFLRSRDHARRTTEKITVDDAVAEQLRQLGYLRASSPLKNPRTTD